MLSEVNDRKQDELNKSAVERKIRQLEKINKERDEFEKEIVKRIHKVEKHCNRVVGETNQLSRLVKMNSDDVRKLQVLAMDETIEIKDKLKDQNELKELLYFPNKYEVKTKKPDFVPELDRFSYSEESEEEKPSVPPLKLGAMPQSDYMDEFMKDYKNFSPSWRDKCKFFKV